MPIHARVAKLADALDLGSCTLIGVGVRLPPLAFLIQIDPGGLQSSTDFSQSVWLTEILLCLTL